MLRYCHSIHHLMHILLHRTLKLFIIFLSPLYLRSQTTDTYTSQTTWTVPAGVFSVSIKVYGGGGGRGGQDCGAGCTNTLAGNSGYVIADFTVAPGDVIGIYPGGKGSDGLNSVSGSGGGAGGTDTYPSGNYDGGNGGNAGASGSSGGGGGGGAASVITINSTIKIIAGGAGGGGGMANMANSGWDGNSSTSSNGTTTGGNGTTPGGDGGGGGGGGGGQFASAGGGVHAAGGESAGNGGFLGANSISGASSITTDGNISWTNAGRIEVTYLTTLPVTWLNFTANRQNKNIILNWSTVTEQNSKDFIIQHSLNGSDWNNIGTVIAAGNSNTEKQYSFTDTDPNNGQNFYRLQQRDINNSGRYSKVVFIDLSIKTSKVRLFPNPVVGRSTSISLEEAATVIVYNTTGSKLLEKKFPAGTNSFDLSSLAPGTFFLRVKDETISFVVK